MLALNGKQAVAKAAWHREGKWFLGLGEIEDELNGTRGWLASPSLLFEGRGHTQGAQFASELTLVPFKSRGLKLIPIFLPLRC